MITAMTATAVLLVMTIIHGPLAALVISIFIYMITIGMTLTSTFTLAMEKQGHRAGSASALLGMLPLLLGSIVSPLVGMNEATAVPMGAIMFTTSVIGSIAFFALTTKPEKAKRSEMIHSFFDARYSYFFSTIAELCPPKPNELERPIVND